MTMADIIDGKKIASDIREGIAKDVEKLKQRGIQPHLTTVLVGENPASQSYVRGKERACQKIGISALVEKYPDSISQEELLQIVNRLNEDRSVHGILVQLPLPKQIDEKTIIQAICPSKDVDGFHPINFGKLAAGIEDTFAPCTPSGIIELLVRSGNPPEGQHVVIVGRSNLVSKPVGFLLLRKKSPEGNATVSFCHSRTRNLGEITKTADILIAAIGQPEMITKDMVKAGVVVIDVGVNRVDDPNQEKGYRLVGDVQFDTVSEKASAITPVPGGVGPMTITELLRNTLKACRQITESG